MQEFAELAEEVAELAGNTTKEEDTHFTYPLFELPVNSNYNQYQPKFSQEKSATFTGGGLTKIIKLIKMLPMGGGCN